MIVVGQVELFLVQAIIITRLYAIYKYNTWILRCLVALYIVSMAAGVLVLVILTGYLPGNRVIYLATAFTLTANTAAPPQTVYNMCILVSGGRYMWLIT
jgi:hypothetical protein